MAIQSFNRYGFAYKHAASLTDSFTIHECARDATNNAQSGKFPVDCNVQSVEVELSGMSTGGSTPTQVTMYLARDSEGDVGVTPGASTGATENIRAGATTANTGFVVFAIDSDVHYDATVGLSKIDSIYACLKLDTGTATANVRINWRA